MKPSTVVLVFFPLCSTLLANSFIYNTLHESDDVIFRMYGLTHYCLSPSCLFILTNSENFAPNTISTSPTKTRHVESASMDVNRSFNTTTDERIPKMGTKSAKGATTFGEYSRNNFPQRAKASTVETKPVYTMAPAPDQDISESALT